MLKTVLEAFSTGPVPTLEELASRIEEDFTLRSSRKR
jgi:hypothetical protein